MPGGWVTVTTRATASVILVTTVRSMPDNGRISADVEPATAVYPAARPLSPHRSDRGPHARPMFDDCVAITFRATERTRRSHARPLGSADWSSSDPLPQSPARHHGGRSVDRPVRGWQVGAFNPRSLHIITLKQSIRRGMSPSTAVGPRRSARPPRTNGQLTRPTDRLGTTMRNAR